MAAQAPPAAAAAGDKRVYASPMAKRLAEQRNIRLQGKGTGLYDSITSGDLEGIAKAVGAGAAGGAPPPPISVPAGKNLLHVSVIK